MLNGIIRRFDDLGRIVIPKEIRRYVLGTTTNEGMAMEIAIGNGNSIILKPFKAAKLWKPVMEQGEIKGYLCPCGGRSEEATGCCPHCGEKMECADAEQSKAADTRLTSYDYENGEILLNEEERLLSSKGFVSKEEMDEIVKHLAKKLFEYEQSKAANTRLTSYDYENGEILLNEEERLLSSKGFVSKEEMDEIVKHLAKKLFEYEQAEESI